MFRETYWIPRKPFTPGVRIVAMKKKQHLVQQCHTVDAILCRWHAPETFYRSTEALNLSFNIKELVENINMLFFTIHGIRCCCCCCCCCWSSGLYAIYPHTFSDIFSFNYIRTSVLDFNHFQRFLFFLKEYLMCRRAKKSCEGISKRSLPWLT